MPMPSSRRKFLCLDCKVDTGKIAEHYMLKDDVWFSVHPSRSGMLCIGCIEVRLGRMLNKQDFNDSYLNKARTAPQSMRLRKRFSG